MEQLKKGATAGTMATDKTNFFPNASDKQCNQQQYHVEGLIGTGVIHPHETMESALRESRTRVQNL